MHLGQQYDARVYKVFCFSILSFLWQLLPVTPRVLEAEKFALRKFASGPGNWATTHDLFQLANRFGFPYAFPSAELTAIAAKLRVHKFEPLDYSHKLHTLEIDVNLGPHRQMCWDSW